MFMDISAPEFQENLRIPIDLFVSKKRHGLIRGGASLRYADSSGNLVYRVERVSPKSARKRVVLDSSGNPLIYIHRNKSGSWKCYKRENSEENDLIFRAEKTANAFNGTEFEIFSVGGNGEAPKSDLKMKGSPFHRSCTVYKGESILAQTSLMYKLGIQKVLVWRHRFRLTIFPEFIDHAFIIALIAIFFDGRKLWI
ncbi:hypothetical protein NMG60_11034311 [Bertholletia excelsa]